MARAWIAEQPSRWDADKQRIIGGEPPGTFPMKNPAEGDLLPGSWWRVEQDGAVVGYGRLDVTWGEGQVLIAVARGLRGQGIGAFVLDQLAAEAGREHLRVIYNSVHRDHPAKQWTTDWFLAHGFERYDDEMLRRAVR